MATKSASRALPRAVRRTRCPKSHASARSIATAASIEHSLPEPPIPQPQPASILPDDRLRTIRNAKPFSDFLTDTFDRQHDYLRISLTERCNLRCTYCMPEEGVQLSPNRDILTTAEILYLSALFIDQGVNKIRLTGGEPTVRKDIIPLMQQLGALRSNGLKEIALTTNGISLHRKLDDMVAAGLTGVNISLDTLDPHEFVLLTRRQGFNAVMKSISKVDEMNKVGANIKLKINCVAMRGLNDHQIIPFVEMTRTQDIEVRFIEYMPFGGNKWSKKKMLPYDEMLELIRAKYPTITRLKGAKNDTSKTWQVPGFQGSVGFITSMTHNFCGTCNRLRITSDGSLKVCLHGNTEVSLRDLLRRDHGGEPMDEHAFEAIRQLELDRRKQLRSGMLLDSAAGWMSKEQELLQVIGAAVKRKKAAHAGIDERPYDFISQFQGSPSFGTSTSPRFSPKQSAMLSGLQKNHLQPLQPTYHQSRLYSSDGRKADHESNIPDADEKPLRTTPASLVSSFGFQSLSTLLQEPPKGRYSRPRERHASGQTALADNEVVDNEDTRRSRTRGVGDFFRPSVEPALQGTNPFENLKTGSTHSPPVASDGELQPPLSLNTAASSDTSSHETEQVTSHVVPAWEVKDRIQGLPRIRRTDMTPTPSSTGRSRYMRPIERHSKVARLSANRTSPSALARNGDASHQGHKISKPRTIPDPMVESAWGLSTANASIEPPIFRPATAEVRKDAPAGMPQSSIATQDRLTHVNESGEAHMVDVGPKQHTRRVAIAYACVSFSNPEPSRLISENKNRKGDVLGMSRIAGIMAAKRTSDLIPLCHPIMISKAEVNVEHYLPKEDNKIGHHRQYGQVAIIAQVECVGPTGVEMEALSAANVAALTVYDMCKAVDRGIEISGIKVLYKHGGRSGMYFHQSATRLSTSFYLERGLEPPPSATLDSSKIKDVAKAETNGQATPSIR